MRSYQLRVAVARDGTRFVQEPGETEASVQARCQAYEDAINKKHQDALIGHAQFYGAYPVVQQNNDGLVDVFRDYSDLYVHIYDREGVDAVNAYLNGMRRVIDLNTGTRNDYAQIDIITEDDIGKTVWLYYYEGYNAWARSKKTLEEMIESLERFKDTVHHYSTDEILKNQMYVLTEDVQG